MIRLALLSIVLTLASGPSVLLCKAWCEPQQAPVVACHDTGATCLKTTGGDHCNDLAVNNVGFVPEDVRARVSTSAVHSAIVSHHFQFAPPCTDAGADNAPGQGQFLNRRPSVTTLRI